MKQLEQLDYLIKALKLDRFASSDDIKNSLTSCSDKMDEIIKSGQLLDLTNDLKELRVSFDRSNDPRNKSVLFDIHKTLQKLGWAFSALEDLEGEVFKLK
jgi:hypothetical protein